MFRKKSIIKYESAVSITPDLLIPIKNVVPDWFKKIPKWKNNEVFEIGSGIGKTVKQCSPILDSFTIGYTIVLPSDIYVKNNNGAPYLTWQHMDFPPIVREQTADLNLVPAGHNSTEYAWKVAVANTIPLGYSMIITHPFNRHDLPFTTLTGIVDGGFVMHANGQIPFFVKENFEGLIPKGTPIVQIVPFRQENWKSKETKGLLKESSKHNLQSLSLISGWYKKTFWTHKKYD